MNDTKNNQKIFVLSALIGVLYLGWFFGYFFNPVVALNGVASDLAVSTQPDWYLYVVFHSVMLVAVLYLCILLWRDVKQYTQAKWALVLYFLFGVFTLVSSVISLPCASSVEPCQLTGRSFVHLGAGIIAVASLSIAFLIVLRMLENKIAKRVFSIVLLLTWLVAISNTYLMLLSFSGPMIAISQRLFLAGFASIAIALPLVLQSATQSYAPIGEQKHK